MTTTFTIIGTIFSIIYSICFIVDYKIFGIVSAVLAILSFIIALCVNFKKKKTPKLNLKEFTFVDPPGYYTHKKYPGQKICPTCLIKNKSISPVSQISENAWYCNVCDKPLSGSKGDVFILR